MISSRRLFAWVSILLLWPASTAFGQQAVEDGAAVGYELALTGSVSAERGSNVHLSGIAYEVEGLATLRPTAGLVLDGEILAYQADGTTRVVGSASVRSSEGGHFEIGMLVPEESLSGAFVRLRVHRAAGPGRVFDFALSQLASRLASLLTDRDRYEPGETVHVFSLVRSARGLAPIARRAVRIELLDPTNATLAEREMETSTAGVATMDVELPESAMPGFYRVRIAFDPATPPTVRTIEVFQRTTERVMATMTLDQELVGPSERLTGRIHVTTPSGVAIAGAQVELHVGSGSGELTELVTDAAGNARIDTNAPSFLSGDAEIQSAWARITHPAYGSITTSASYTLSRTRWLVSATPEGGGLVPEIDSQLFLTVADPRGRPITAGTSVDVRGLGIAGGHATATTDAHGVAMITVRLPRGAAARLSGGACGRSVASTTLDVEIGTTPAVSASVCSPVALEAGVLVRAQSPIATPGARVELEISRRPSSQGRVVLVEALFQGRAVAFSWLAGSASHGSLTLPSDLSGVITIRARPVAPADARSPLDQPGATSFGVGATTAILVRPADAFALTVTPDQPLHGVQEHAMVSLTTSAPPTQAWAALVARDEAQLGGESDFAIEWILGELREAIRAGAGPQHDRYVRAALAAGLALDTRATVAPPLVRDAWDDGGRYYGRADGILRDPIAMREELVRRGVAQVMVALEGLVQRLGSNQELRDQVTHTTGRRVEFAPDVLRYMHDQGQIGAMTTLGGEPMTVAMLTATDPSFSFDSAARRVARARLVRLLVTLASLTNADDEAALRASAGAPPDRWLSLLVQLGMLAPDDLVDPWGHAFVMRRATGRRASVVVSERALDWELSSPGPDGVPGNGDDVRDPFQRAIPRGTPYAVACGEDALLAQLSTIAPGQQVLAAMAMAYQRLGLAAQEERRGGVVTATTSESTSTPMAPPMEAQMVEMGGYGGEGMALGRAAPTTRAPSPHRSMRSADEDEMSPEPEASDMPDQDADGILDLDDAFDAMATAGALIREDFPATLFFVGEVALDAAGHATVDVPLADAITTYRLEAIAWTSSGWITSGRATVRVDQEAMVDAPVPEAATIGDVLRLPVRVQNRTDAVLRAQLSAAVEGDVSIDVGALSVLEVPPHGAAEQIVTLTLRTSGEGALVIRAAHEDGRALDAVRRPIRVFDDARLVREHREALIEDGGSLSIDLPPQAQNRGPAQLRLSVAGAIFGDVSDLADADPFWAGFTLAIDGVTLPDDIADQLAGWLRIDERYGNVESYYNGRDAQQVALAIGAMWNDPRLDDRSIGGALRYLGILFADQGEGELAPYYGGLRSASLTLLALAPAVRSTGRSELRESLDTLVGQLRRAASTEGASAVESPEAWARVAAALFLSRRAGDDDARAVEMLRRTERSVITVGDVAWLEPDTEDGSMEPRVAPTALLALARIAHGDARGALPLIRSLAEVARGAPRWPAAARALAATAAALLATGPGEGPLEVTLDGARVETRLEAGGVVLATLPDAARPGSHTLVFDLPDGALALLRLDVRYGMPWDVAPLREAPITIEWSGETGARDTRSGLSVTVQNRGTRVLTHPIVEIEMPAGTELDEPTREALAGLLVAAPSMEGTTLHLELRPMAPAGYVRLPIRARWAVSGTLRGLGVSVYDEAGPGASGLRATAILPSRAVEIADHGPEASPEEPESSAPPRPPPPPPILRPLAEVVR